MDALRRTTRCKAAPRRVDVGGRTDSHTGGTIPVTGTDESRPRCVNVFAKGRTIMHKSSELREIGPQDIRAQASADGHVVVVTDDLLRIGSGDNVQLDVPIEDVRRIQFDIERDRPATLVIVPDAAWRDSQVIMVEPDDYEGVAHAIAVLGSMMADRRN